VCNACETSEQFRYMYTHPSILLQHRNVLVHTISVHSMECIPGNPLFHWKKIRDFSRSFQDPVRNFPGPFRSPGILRYKEKTPFTHNIRSIVHCRNCSHYRLFIRLPKQQASWRVGHNNSSSGPQSVVFQSDHNQSIMLSSGCCYFQMIINMT